ncbi:MAG TPA: DUF1549 domain-containing protein, partial [Chthonomonadales bacterium]|nr:DUF1549 domain-containing protein [Chthonomonadales bacterium]
MKIPAALLLLLCLLPCSAAPARRKPPLLDFTQTIRPILADNCFTCHGNDHLKRMAGLRLDERSSALAIHAIVPFKPGSSLLISRINSRDSSQLMPPPASHKRLTPGQKKLLYLWIAQGARYEPHWSFVPLPASVPVPAIKDTRWVRNEIDSFVLARLRATHVLPSPQANRLTWLRRVTYDLIGLPPTPAEMDSFVQDRKPGAYARVVDRLLASSHFGEHTAVGWLDLARYADSYGYQSDQLCPTWPYRDWVVSAFNRNMPYSRFVSWQLA